MCDTIIIKANLEVHRNKDQMKQKKNKVIKNVHRRSNFSYIEFYFVKPMIRNQIANCIIICISPYLKTDIKNAGTRINARHSQAKFLAPRLNSRQQTKMSEGGVCNMITISDIFLTINKNSTKQS